MKDLYTPYKIVFIGYPNVGKTSLFNKLTHSYKKIGNYSGVTMEVDKGHFSYKGKDFEVFDLPGSYTLLEGTGFENLKNFVDKDPKILFVCVLDITQINQQLKLILELKHLNIPFCVILNMLDTLSLKLDKERIQEDLQIPIFNLDRNQKGYLLPLKEFMYENSLILQEKSVLKSHLDPSHFDLEGAYKKIDKYIEQWPPILFNKTYHWDRFFLHPVWGSLFFIFILLFIFQSVFNLAKYPQSLIEVSLSFLKTWVEVYIPFPIFQSFIIEGVLAGIGALVLFIPQICILFFWILTLEQSGYMARAVFLSDRWMSYFGLSGQGFIPLLSSFACAIPGILATRNIARPHERLITILIAPLMTCSARLPVYTLLISAFIPNTPIWGVFHLQGLVFVGLHVLAVIIGLCLSLILKYCLYPQDHFPFFMELPLYKKPYFPDIFKEIFMKVKIFVKKIGTGIFLYVCIFWILGKIAWDSQQFIVLATSLNDSLIGQIGQLIQPLFKPLGFNWQIAVSLIPGFLAREVLVSTLSTLYAWGSLSGETLSHTIQQQWSLATGLSLLIWYVFAPQCFSTLLVIKKETKSNAWPIFVFCYMIIMAYAFSFVTYQVFKNIA